MNILNHRIGILTTEINPDIIELMLAAAREEATERNVDIARIVMTTGTFDMPVIAKKMMEDVRLDGIVLLGAVAKGETQHDELVVNAMTSAIIQLSVEYMKPVGFGVIGPGAKPEYFMGRVDEYAKRAVEAVVTNIDILRNYNQPSE